MLSFQAPLALSLLLVPGLFAQDPIRVVVGFKVGPDPTLLEAEGGRPGRVLPAARALVTYLTPGSISRLRARPEVAFVEEDGPVLLFQKAKGKKKEGKKKKGGGGKPKDPPSQSTPWGISRVGGARKGTGIKVAVIDTGLDLDHPDLKGNIKGGVNYVRPGKAPEDDHGHGSHVGGTIAALNNSQGVVGVASEAWLYGLKVLDRNGGGWWSDVAAAVDWTAKNGIQIANMSLGATSAPGFMKASCEAAFAKGVLLVAAAGNHGDGNTKTVEVSYPAGYASVVSVGATDSGDRLAWFSATNADLELGGPGVKVRSTWKGGGYRTLSGTSMASPHAAGVAAVIWKNLAGASNSSLRRELQLRAEDKGPVGRDPGFGFGIVRHLQ